MITSITPSVYKIKYSKTTGYYLEYYQNRFAVLGKSYGELNKHLELVWSNYRSKPGSMGCCCVGAPGSGKSRLSHLLANRALDNGMCVILAIELETNIELIAFIDNLVNMVVIFDEFSKNFTMTMQNKMLPMFSAIDHSRKKLFILNENDRNSISPFIRTRPGRVRYCFDYDRVSESVIMEYCADYNISTSFIADIMVIYQKAPKFTFDHLQALVTEHISSPDYSIDELMEVLNLDDLVQDPLWYPTIVTKLGSSEVWEIGGVVTGQTKERISSNYFRCWVDIAKVDKAVKSDSGMGRNPTKALNITSNALQSIEEDDVYVFKVNGYLIQFVKRE